MKKQFFLLSLLLAAFNVTTSVVVANSCGSSCGTGSCNSSNSCGSSNSCSTTPGESSCSKACCVPSHGHTFMSITPEWGGASPERVALFETDRLESLREHEKRGSFQMAVFGGRNTKESRTAGYYLPYGHTQLTFDGSVKPAPFAQVLAESDALIVNAAPTVDSEISVSTLQIGTPVETGTTATAPALGNYNLDGNIDIAVDPATFYFDSNTDTSKILPWNFGITYAALFEPRGASASGSVVGTGLITQPQFKSTINPCLRRWHVGVGAELVYHLSDDMSKGFYIKASTAVQHVHSRIRLNEQVITEKDPLNSYIANANPTGSAITNQTAPGLVTEPYGSNTLGSNGDLFDLDLPTNGVATVTPVGSLYSAYIGKGSYTTGFPTDVENGESSAPQNVTQAFNQAAWNYGKIGCGHGVTRLADIELSLGYIWTCSDCASTTWELGIVIPTGNKPCAQWVAPAVVGNNKHVGIRMGSTTEIMMCENDCSKTSFRIDTDSRYLFKNCQMRSFDVQNKEWSRYMMVWESEDAYQSALTAFSAQVTTPTGTTALSANGQAYGFLAQRGYTPGINVFTTDFHIKPQFEGRANFAAVYAGERFRAELGWNTHVRQKECVEVACGWNSNPAFADSSYIGGLGLNNHRTIYNDAQTSVTNCVESLNRGGYTLDGQPLAYQTLAYNTTADFYPLAVSPVTGVALKRYNDFALTVDDIDLDSVASEGYIAQKPYAAFGYALDYECRPTFSLGGSYEFTQSNRSINQWMLWGKFELAF